MTAEPSRSPVLNKTESHEHRGCKYSVTFDKDFFFYDEVATAMCTFDNSQGTATVDKIKFKFIRTSINKLDDFGVYDAQSGKKRDIRFGEKEEKVIKFAEYAGVGPGMKT